MTAVPSSLPWRLWARRLRLSSQAVVHQIFTVFFADYPLLLQASEEVWLSSDVLERHPHCLALAKSFPSSGWQLSMAKASRTEVGGGSE